MKMAACRLSSGPGGRVAVFWAGEWTNLVLLIFGSILGPFRGLAEVKGASTDTCRGGAKVLWQGPVATCGRESGFYFGWGKKVRF